jgi:hypothetical protein
MAVGAVYRRCQPMESMVESTAEPTIDDLVGSDEPELGDSLAITALSLARHFAAGATLWCVAPEWPEHARHVAVEFVHPVLVGKRALPAVSLDVADPVAALRTLARAGDVVLVISNRDDLVAASITRRAPAWGASTIWMGGGPLPALGAADHLVWATPDNNEAQGSAVHDGRLVLLYHVLWELTHVCFEHTGLLTSNDESECYAEICVTCSDERRRGPPRRGDRHRWRRRDTGSHGPRYRDDRHHHRRSCRSRRSPVDPRWCSHR